MYLVDKMKKINDRIDDLEARLAFQDDTIQALNSTIITQQKQLDLLKRKMELLIKRHNEILEQWQEVEDNSKPPHY